MRPHEPIERRMEGGERHAVHVFGGPAGGGPGGVEDGEVAGAVVSLPSVAGFPGAPTRAGLCSRPT